MNYCALLVMYPPLVFQAWKVQEMTPPNILKSWVKGQNMDQISNDRKEAKGTLTFLVAFNKIEHEWKNWW